MSDPERLLDSHANARARRLLRRGREMNPPAGLEGRVWTALGVGAAAVMTSATASSAFAANAATTATTATATTGAAVAGGAAGAAGAAGAGTAKAVAIFGGTVAKWISAVAITGAVAGGGYVSIAESSGEASNVAVAPQRLAVSANGAGRAAARARPADPKPEIVPDELTEALSFSELTPVPGARRPSTPLAIVGALDAAIETETDEGDTGEVDTDDARRRADESALILSARAALLEDRPKRALGLLRDIGIEGGLAQERAVLELEALLDLGQMRRADQRAAAFARRFPDSPYAERVQRLMH